MSKIQELYERVAADTALQEKFNRVLFDAKKSGEAAVHEKLLNFAREAGFDVTVEEMRAFFQALAEEQEGELSDAELDSVAGGKGIPVGAVFSVVVIMCVLGSVVYEIGWSCKEELIRNIGK